jgi:hypothetical protein
VQAMRARFKDGTDCQQMLKKIFPQTFIIHLHNNQSFTLKEKRPKKPRTQIEKQTDLKLKEGNF